MSELLFRDTQTQRMRLTLYSVEDMPRSLTIPFLPASLALAMLLRSR